MGKKGRKGIDDDEWLKEFEDADVKAEEPAAEEAAQPAGGQT